MSIDAMSLVFWADPEKVSSTEKLVLLAMADYGNNEGYGIWPSVKTLAIKSSLSERTVQAALKKLQESNLVTFVAEPVMVKGKCIRGNEYTLNIDLLFSICVDIKTKKRVIKTTPGIGSEVGEAGAPTQVQEIHPPESDSPTGVNLVREVGEAAAPETLFKHHIDDEENIQSNNSSDPVSIWDDLSTRLSESLPRSFFVTWVAPARPISFENGTLIIGVPNQVARDQLRERIGPTCNRIIPGLVDVPGARVEFVHRPEPAVRRRA